MSHSPETETVHSIFKKIPVPLSNPVKITDTLQGSIWRASAIDNSTGNPRSVVIKITNQNQHTQSISIVNNNIYRNIKENIVSEQSILKYLSQQTDCDHFITKFIRFFKLDGFFILIQDDGGPLSLFHFVCNAHRLIQSSKIDIHHWKAVVKVIFKRLIKCVAFIHSNNVCHNDISLENLVINDVLVEVDELGQIKFDTDSIQIKLCDFGLAELHANPECLSRKHCGKTQYKSPEVIQLKRPFDAKKNDIWSVGVCLFMLSFGIPPWAAARVSDELFCCVMNGHLVPLLKAWNLRMYVDTHCVDLFRSIFKYEEDRISVRQMEQHKYLN